ncbi:MAG: AAA-like domain-containing protein [Prochloraceae cyanobacterium]
MDFSEGFKIADRAVFAATNRHLKDIEKIIFEGSWQNQSYEEIADAAGYAHDYIRGDVAPKFWKMLSEGLGEKVTKRNFRTALERKSTQQNYKPIPIDRENNTYIERSPLESKCIEAIASPGAFLRIKAPQQMGKTFLLNQIVDRSRQQNYLAVLLNFGLEDSEVFSNYRQFLQSFCAGVTNLLELPNQLADYWSDNLGSNRNTKRYFEKYILESLDSPLILALDKVDCVFEHPDIAMDFCRLLRDWHDMASRGDRRGQIWGKLRLIIAHSTDVYSQLNINSSPLAGIGKVFLLPEFTPEQIQSLATQFNLSFTKIELKKLMDLLGGHPYLIRLACEYLDIEGIALAELVAISATESGPFGNHLRRHLWNVQQYPDLVDALAEVVNSPAPVQLKSNFGFKLQSMGLVKLEGDLYSPRCDLYRQYFSVHL